MEQKSFFFEDKCFGSLGNVAYYDENVHSKLVKVTRIIHRQTPTSCIFSNFMLTSMTRTENYAIKTT